LCFLFTFVSVGTVVLLSPALHKCFSVVGYRKRQNKEQMKFSPINCWLLTSEIADIDAIRSNDKDMQIVKKSILKNGYRAFLLDNKDVIETKQWYLDFLIGNEIRVYIDGSGVYKIANIDLSDNEIYFEKLNIPIGYKPWLFFSWQSDFNSSRSVVKEVLDEICEDINANFNPKQPIQIISPLREEDGAGNILDSLKKNIDLSLMFISDVTNVGQITETQNGQSVVTKNIPNPNVVFELSYSFVRKKIDQIIIVKKKREDLQPDILPFDFAQNRITEFTNKAGLKRTLDGIIKGYLRRINFIANT
jgi:hypothetical protein